MWNKQVAIQLVSCAIGSWSCSSPSPSPALTDSRSGSPQLGTVAAPTSGTQPLPGGATSPAPTSQPARSGAGATSTAPSAGSAPPAARAAAGTPAVSAGAAALGGSNAASARTAGADHARAVAGTSAAGASAGGAGAPPRVECPADGGLKPGETNYTLMINDMPRTFILHVPAGYSGEAMPLVVDFHPLGQSKEFERGNSGYRQLSESEGFIVAWPQGIQNAWNVGPCCTESREIHDVEFARALVADVSKRVCVDPKRVYATGYSMGGGLSHYLACHAADVFATVAPSAFDLFEENSPQCQPARPISVISFRGTLDPIAPFNGGPSSPPTMGYRLPDVHFLGAQATFKRWAELDGCTGEPSDSGSGCKTYTSCKDGVEVTLCVAQGGSHVTGDAKRGWATMKQHPMP